jgi:hypothetical protein
MTYTFRQIRNAILEASGRPEGFPLDGGLAPARLEALRATPYLAAMLDEIRLAARRATAEPPTELPFDAFQRFETTGTRREYERPYFARRGRLAALALAATIDQDAGYVPALQETIWAICNEYTWCVPAHIGRNSGTVGSGRLPPEQSVDLFASETAHALAETLTLLGERLDPWMHYRVRSEIERRVFRPLFYDPVHFHWESVPMNWASVCAGACGMAAMLLEDDPERLAGMVERCVRAMECFLEGFGPDGGCAEGVGYWQYGFGYYVYFSEMLRDYTRGAIDLLAGELIGRVAAFPAGVSLGGDAFVNYSDGSAHMHLRPGLVSRVALRTGAPSAPVASLPSFHDDHCYRWPHITRDLVWTDPALLGSPVELGTTRFEHLGWVVDRRMLGETLVAFSARAGNNGEPHNQNDLGHFIVHVGGESLLADLGAGLYTRQYFSATRYEHIHNSSEGHSVPRINGQNQQPGAAHAAQVLRCEPQAEGVVFEIELAGAYDVPGLRSLRRTFRWSAGPGSSVAQLELRDQTKFAQAPESFEELLISLHEPEMHDGRVVWRGRGGSVELRFDPAQLSASVERIDSQDHSGAPIAIHRVRLLARTPRAEDAYRLDFTCQAAE